MRGRRSLVVMLVVSLAVTACGRSELTATASGSSVVGEASMPSPEVVWPGTPLTGVAAAEDGALLFGGFTLAWVDRAGQVVDEVALDEDPVYASVVAADGSRLLSKAVVSGGRVWLLDTESVLWVQDGIGAPVAQVATDVVDVVALADGEVATMRRDGALEQRRADGAAGWVWAGGTVCGWSASGGSVFATVSGEVPVVRPDHEPYDPNEGWSDADLVAPGTRVERISAATGQVVGTVALPEPGCYLTGRTDDMASVDPSGYGSPGYVVTLPEEGAGSLADFTNMQDLEAASAGGPWDLLGWRYEGDGETEWTMIVVGAAIDGSSGCLPVANPDDVQRRGLSMAVQGGIVYLLGVDTVMEPGAPSEGTWIVTFPVDALGPC